jgi:hypothetical protein
MRIDELTMPGTPTPPVPGAAPNPQNAQTGLSPQQQLAQDQARKAAEKKQINDEIAAAMKHLANLRNRLKAVGP